MVKTLVCLIIWMSIFIDVNECQTIMFRILLSSHTLDPYTCHGCQTITLCQDWITNYFNFLSLDDIISNHILGNVTFLCAFESCFSAFSLFGFKQVVELK